MLIISNIIKEKTKKSGEILLQQGREKTKIYMIIEGNCDMIYEHLNRPPRKQRYAGNHPFKIRAMGPSDFIGIEPLKYASIDQKSGLISNIKKVRCRLSILVRSSKVRYVEVEHECLNELPIEIKVSFFIKIFERNKFW